MEPKPQRNSARVIFAFVLIGIGMIWILRKWGIYYDFPDINLHHFFVPFRSFFQGVWDFIFSWQVVFIIIGLLLLAGNRPVGIVLIAVGGIFLLPEILAFPPFSLSFILPAILIGAGVAVIVHSL